MRRMDIRPVALCHSKWPTSCDFTDGLSFVAGSARPRWLHGVGRASGTACTRLSMALPRATVVFLMVVGAATCSFATTLFVFTALVGHSDSGDAREEGRVWPMENVREGNIDDSTFHRVSAMRAPHSLPSHGEAIGVGLCLGPKNGKYSRGRRLPAISPPH